MSNTQTITIEVNGQQQKLIDELVAKDPAGRSAGEIVAQGFAEFVKLKRLGQAQ